MEEEKKLIGQALAKVRKAKGYSQTEIANFLQTTQQQYSKYEQGKQEPSARIIKKLSEFYNVPANKLIAVNKFMAEEDRTNAFFRLYDEATDMFNWAEDQEYITNETKNILQTNLVIIKEKIMDDL